MGKRNSVSFIIPVLNGAAHIGDCLDHIQAEMEAGDEIIVVDNGSTDGTLDIVKEYDVRVLEFPDITIAGLRNRGAEIAGGTLLAFIDSDCLLLRGWREAVEDILGDDSIHATGSISAVPESARWVEKAWLSQRYKNRTKVYYMGSANFIVKKEIFQEVGGFDESLVTDEDTDIGIRITEKGYNIVEDPAVGIIHLGNSKTLSEYYKRQRWHATSVIDTAFKEGIDKPFIMTVLFMLCSSLSFIYLIFSGINEITLFLLALSLLAIPALTAFYKVITFKNAGYFFHLVILFFIFYLARSITITQYLFKRLASKGM